VALAAYIALGIGFHNFGEGLAIGAAFAAGQAALGSFLVIGFTLHNLTEGVGIVAPLVDRRPSAWLFIGLAMLAGLPAVLGAWAGAFAYAPQWGALLLGVGAGAILLVIVEVGRYLLRIGTDAGRQGAWSSGVAGFASGIAVMYATSLLVSF
jgi:zinc transporter ZupT